MGIAGTILNSLKGCFAELRKHCRARAQYDFAALTYQHLYQLRNSILDAAALRDIYLGFMDVCAMEVLLS